LCASKQFHIEVEPANYLYTVHQNQSNIVGLYLSAHGKTHQFKTGHQKWTLSSGFTEKVHFLDFKSTESFQSSIMKKHF